jgi:hypothetical protein
MRLKQHINESNDDRGVLGDDELDDLKKGCMPFLKDVKKAQKHYWHYLFRGFQRREGDFSYKKPRADRRPTDSSPAWHDVLDIVMKKKFGVKARSEGVFCKTVTPTGYGMDYMVFPIGKYKCIWSDMIMDAYFQEPGGFDYDPDDPGNRYEQDMERYMAHGEHIIDMYQQGGIHKVAASLNGPKQKHEVALICKSYYMADIKFRDQLDDWIKNEI